MPIEQIREKQEENDQRGKTFEGESVKR